MERIDLKTIRADHRARRPKGPNRGNWFGPEELRFFGTTFPNRSAYRVGDLAFFVTGETPDDTTPHRYSVRAYDFNSVTIDTVGKFQQYATAADASAAAILAADAFERGEMPLPDSFKWARENPAGDEPPPELMDPKAIVVDKLRFWRKRPQQWFDAYRKTWRLCLFVGNCLGCGRNCYEFTDGENDPRGALGDYANGGLTAKDYDAEGPDLALCAICENEEPRYSAALEKARRKYWKAKTPA